MNIDNASNIDNSQIKTEQLADMGKQITAYQKEKQILYEQLLTGKITKKLALTVISLADKSLGCTFSNASTLIW